MTERRYQESIFFMVSDFTIAYVFLDNFSDKINDYEVIHNLKKGYEEEYLL